MVHTYLGGLVYRLCYEEIDEPLLVLLSLIDHEGIWADLGIDLHVLFWDREMEGVSKLLNQQRVLEKLLRGGGVKGSPG